MTQDAARFDVAISGASFAGLAVLSLIKSSPRAGRRHLGWLRQLTRWSMLDVFGLATAVVIVKIGGLAHVEARSGLWLFLSAALLSAGLSWRIDRR